MFGVAVSLFFVAAGAMAIWSIAATIAPKFDLIVTLLRHGAQPMNLEPDPAPNRIEPRITRRPAVLRLQPQRAMSDWREAA